MERYFYGTNSPTPVHQSRLHGGKFVGICQANENGYDYYMVFSVPLTKEEEEDLSVVFIKKISLGNIIGKRLGIKRQ